MVRLELRLVAVDRRAAILEDHARVVDEDVESVVRPRERGANSRTDANDARSSGITSAAVAAARLDLRERGRAARRVARGDHDVRAGARERDRGLQADARSCRP